MSDVKKIPELTEAAKKSLQDAANKFRKIETDKNERIVTLNNLEQAIKMRRVYFDEVATKLTNKRHELESVEKDIEMKKKLSDEMEAKIARMKVIINLNEFDEMVFE
jgi:chromosome segregation ATPase